MDLVSSPDDGYDMQMPRRTLIINAFPYVLSMCLALPKLARADTPTPADAPREFTVTAGNAFHDHNSALGVLCKFDFGDPAGAYNVLTGFNAAHIYRTPGNYTVKITSPAGNETKSIHVLPDTRAVQLVRPGDFIPTIIRGLQQDTIVLLPPGSTWEIGNTLDLNARNIEFRPAGPGPAPRFRRIKGVGFPTFILHGLNITFRGIEFDSDQEMKLVGDKKVRYHAANVEAANVVFDDCTFRNIDDAIFGTKLTRNLLVAILPFHRRSPCACEHLDRRSQPRIARQQDGNQPARAQLPIERHRLLQPARARQRHARHARERKP